MDSFDGSRRRDGRSPLPPAERRPSRDGEPLEQRLDRWMSTGRQLVEGVSGGRPGARQGQRRGEGRAGQRGGFDGLGRWVEDRLDWLLDDSDDWPEPWQEGDRRPGNAAAREPVSAPAATGRPRSGPSPSDRGVGPRRRRLEAISRRSAANPSEPAPTSPSPDPQDWPDDTSFSVARWQRPAAPLRQPDPLRTELEPRIQGRNEGPETPPAMAPARPLPRSSRRR